jgi:hypothetical protein
MIDECWVAQAIDKNTGFFKTSYSTGTKEEAVKMAKYYRSIGYNAKVYPANEEYDKALEDNSKLYYEQCKLQV